MSSNDGVNFFLDKMTEQKLSPIESPIEIQVLSINKEIRDILAYVDKFDHDTARKEAAKIHGQVAFISAAGCLKSLVSEANIETIPIQ